jgi:hypothetical protein
MHSCFTTVGRDSADCKTDAELMQVAGDKVKSNPISFPSEQDRGLLVRVDAHRSWRARPASML